MSKRICAFEGTCKNKAYREVYRLDKKWKKKNYDGWYYLCRKHFEEEKKRMPKSFDSYSGLGN